MSYIVEVVHTAWTRTTGGRDTGASRSFDGHLDIRFSNPGSARIGANPEQLLAAAWSASLASAIVVAARQQRTVVLAGLTIEAEVDLCLADGVHILQARFNIRLPGVARGVAQALVNEAHRTCAYSNATRGNIEVASEVV